MDEEQMVRPPVAPGRRRVGAKRRRPKRVLWSARRERLFLEALAQTACVAASARASARQIAPERWRLGLLTRGRRGTEGAIGGHVAGERFVLIEAATLLPLGVPLAAIGTAVAVSAIGPGDGGLAQSAHATVIGRAVRPAAPVHVSASRAADGAVAIAWTRRSRLGWTWLDGDDAPLAEDAERYRITLTPGIGTPRTLEVAGPTCTYTAADQAADGAAGARGLAVAIMQLGTAAASEPPATAEWTW